MTPPCSACRRTASTRAAAGVRRTVAAVSVVQIVMAAADQAAAEQTPAPRACPTSGSSGRCEGRLPTADGGWVCRAAQATALFQSNRTHLWVWLRSMPEADA